MHTALPHTPPHLAPSAQVKGHIARMAVCLEDSDERIAALAQLFFHELAKKEYKVGAGGLGCGSHTCESGGGIGRDLQYVRPARG